MAREKKIKIISKPMPIEMIKFTSRPQWNLFSNVFESMKSLKRGQCFIIEVPSGKNVVDYRNHVASMISRAPTLPPHGCRFSCKITIDGTLAICL